MKRNVQQQLSHTFTSCLLGLIMASCATGPATKRSTTGVNSIAAESYARHSKEQLNVHEDDMTAACHRGDFSLAEKMDEEIQSPDAWLLNGLGVCAFLDKKLELALYHLRKGLGKTEAKEGKLKAALLNNLGLIYLAQGKRQDAFQYFTQSHTAYPSKVAALNLAGLSVEFAHYQHGLDWLDKLDQKDQEVIALKMRALIGLGKYSNAHGLFKTLTPSLQHREDVAASMAFGLDQMGQTEAALELMQKRQELSFNLHRERSEKLHGLLELKVAAMETARPDNEAQGPVLVRETASQAMLTKKKHDNTAKKTK